MKERNIDLCIMLFTFYLVILYIVFPYFIRFISGIAFSKLPVAIGLIFSAYLVALLTLVNKTVRLRNRYFYFLLYQLFIWCYFLISLLVNAFVNCYPTKYIFASIFSYVLIPLFTLLFVVFSLNSIKIKKKKHFLFVNFLLFIMVIFIPAFFENMIFYTKNSAIFETLKEKHLIMSYYSSILDKKFLKTFSIFSSGLEFGFLSLLLYVFFSSLIQETKKHEFFVIALKFLSLLGIILSFTRIVWMTFILYYVLLFLRRHKLRLSTIFFIQLLLSIVISSIVYYSVLYIARFDIYFVNSIVTRFSSWYEILSFIKDKFHFLNYLFGYGLSQTEIWNPFDSMGYNVFCIDNTFLNLFLLGGGVGVFIFFINYYIILSKLLMIYREQAKEFIFNLVVLWILFPIIMNLNVLVPSVLFIFLYASSIYVIGLYSNLGITYEKKLCSNP